MAYNLSAFAGAGAQFFTDNGDPLTGGLLYVYAAGTTTPATTWTTNSGAVANTNPIVLDAAGRTPNEIWLNSGATYKFILKTSTGVLVGTYDNIPAIDDPTVFNNLITVTGTNTLIGTSVPAYTAYVAGMTLSFMPINTNTGAVTIDVDGLGAKNIYSGSSAVMIPNQLAAGSMITVEYDGTRFQLIGNATQRSIALITGNTASRPAAPTPGLVRLNTETNKFEGYDNSSWTGIGGGATGGGTDTIFFENSLVVTTDYSVPATKNAGTFGPITVNSGVTVTVPSTSVWTIV
jgi:hypothetical protein